MSKNITFFILLFAAAILTYIINPSLSAVVEAVISSRLPNDFVRLLQNSDLVVFAGFWGLFGLLFLMLYIIFPVTYVWYHISSARSEICKLPMAQNPIKRTDKKSFLSQLQGHGFINKLAESYSTYLIQGAEEEVRAEDVKNVRIIKKTGANGQDAKIFILPVRATAPAQVLFNKDSLVRNNLILGFFTIFARVLMGVGVVCLGISFLDYSLQTTEQQTSLLVALQPGMLSFLFCLISAVIVAGFSHSADMILSHNANSLAREINGLFHQNEWQRDMGKMADQFAQKSITTQLQEVLKTSLNRPMEEVSKAVKALSVEQEEKLDTMLSKTLTAFSRDLDEKTAADTAKLNMALKSAAKSTDEMTKQFAEVNAQFSKQMTKQSSAIAKNLTDMQKALNTGEKKSQKELEKVISTLVTEVDNTYKRFADFMESNLKNLETKQKQIDQAANNKESILKDLHSSSRDLGTISNASGKLLEKFTALSSEINIVLAAIQESGIKKLNGSDPDKRDKLKSALKNLKKAASDKISELPDM